MLRVHVKHAHNMWAERAEHPVCWNWRGNSLLLSRATLHKRKIRRLHICVYTSSACGCPGEIWGSLLVASVSVCPPFFYLRVLLRLARNQFCRPILYQATTMLRFEPTSANCLSKLEGDDRWDRGYVEVKDRFRIFKPKGRSFFKGLDDAFTSM